MLMSKAVDGPRHHGRFEGSGRRYQSTTDDGKLREVKGSYHPQQQRHALRDEKPTRDGHDRASDERRKRRRRTTNHRSLSRSRSRSRSTSTARSTSSRQRPSSRGQSHKEIVQGSSNNNRRDEDQRHPHPPPRDRDRRKRYKRSSSAERHLGDHHHHRQQRRKQRHQHRRRSSSCSSESKSRSSSEHRRVVARPKAWLVSDDDDAAGHGEKRPGGGTSHAQHNNNNHNSSHISQADTRHKKKSQPSSWATVEGGALSSLTRADSVGHFLGGRGTVIADTYRVEGDLGLGTFGRVVECLDLNKKKTGRRTVAIKMVRNVKRYYASAVIEAGIVYDVNRRGGRGTSHFAIMYDRFNWLGHYCLVFESLGPSLFDYLKRNKYQPFPINYVRDFSVQLLEALDFLHSFRLIHTDLKPENILLTNCREITRGGQTLPESTRIKIIDFGGATYDDEKKSSVINTRQYRAPEVILGCGWSTPSDLWSAGCILAELYQGELLFATHDNVEHLAMMERIIGPFPGRMVQAASHFNPQLVNQAFDARGHHRMDKALRAESVSYVLNLRKLESIVHPNHDWFLGLLRMTLVIDPQSRALAGQALRSLG